MGKLLDAANAGDKRRMLVELRDEIARTIEACESGRDMAALSKRLMEIQDEVEAVDAIAAKAANPLQKAQAKFKDG